MPSHRYTVRTDRDEDVAYYMQFVMGDRFPNVKFESVDNGCGGWDLKVWANNGRDESIHPNTLEQFRKEAYIFWHAVTSVLKRQKLDALKEE